jgi:putative aminopeptidase FrvX
MDMNIDFLKEVLSIPSISGDESMVRDYIIEYAKENGIEYYTDAKGNLYLTKGSDKMTSGEFYPCVVSHMDTVHRSHSELIESKTNLIIESSTYNEDEDGEMTTLVAKHPITKEQTGIGGDDKCGVYVCLEMFERFDVLKGAFFVEEEIGMKGSRESDDKFFENVGYAIQFDAPSSNWISEICSGVKLFDEDFKGEIKGTLNECGYTKFSIDPFTDVNQLASKYDFNCLNLGCGYYRQHTSSEYVIVEEVFDAIKAGYELITKLGVKKYTHKKIEKKSVLTETKYGYGSYNDYDFEDYYLDDYDEMSDVITDLVISLYAKGLDEVQIKEEVADYLRGIY